MKLVRRFYDWMLGWADSPYGITGLIAVAFIESSVFPIPPTALLVALCLGNPHKWLRFAIACTFASLMGGCLGYLIGWGAWHAAHNFFFNYVPGFSPELFTRIQGYYQKHDFWIVFVLALSPFPYKVVTIAAGVFSVNFPLFFLATLIGRAVRFFVVAAALYYVGEPLRKAIDRWFNLFAFIAVVLIVLSYLLVEVI